MACGVRHQQRKLRDQIFQVVNDISREPVKCLELARFNQRLVGLEQRQMTRDMPTGH